MKNRFLLCMAVALKIVLIRMFCLFQLFALPVVTIVGLISCICAEIFEALSDFVLKKLLRRGLIHDWPDALKGLLGYSRLPRKEKSRF